jgi:DUF177 domain-containing protein
MTSVNVAGLLHEAAGATRDLRLRDHYLALADVELAGPLNGTIRLQRTNRGILARGSVVAPLRRTCARCLEPYVEEVEVQIDEEFVPTADSPGGAGPVREAGEDVLPLDEHNEIDLAPVLHDELSLSEPMHPLCRPDCPGLCPECGAALSSGPHDHGGAEPDPRLAALGRLLPPRQDE